MPIYEYRCDKCGGQFELLVRADTRPACPQCGSAKVEKLFSAFAAHAHSGDAGSPPPCFSSEKCCNLGKCGSGRCGLD